jgi:hypothetical protein
VKSIPYEESKSTKIIWCGEQNQPHRTTTHRLYMAEKRFGYFGGRMWRVGWGF